MTGLILDIIVVVVILLLIIFAVWRGAYKMLFGLVSSLLALILSIVLVSTVTQAVVEKTTIDDRIATGIDAKVTPKIPNADVLVKFYDIDNDGEVAELGFMADGVVKPFSEILAGTPYSIFSKPIESVISNRIGDDNQEVAFAKILIATLVSYIMMAICFVVLLIVLSILVHIILALFKKFVQRTYLGHFVDKFLGAVLGIALAGVIIYGALAIIKLLGTYEFIVPVNNIINDSAITKFLFEKNFVYEWLVKSLDIKTFIDSIISKIGVS